MVRVTCGGSRWNHAWVNSRWAWDDGTQCAGTFTDDLKPWQCVSSNKIGHFLWRKWIPGREVLAEEMPRIRAGRRRRWPPPPPRAPARPPPPPPPPARPMGPPPAPPDMIPTFNTNAYEVPLLPQSTAPGELNWLTMNSKSQLPLSFIEGGHYYHPSVWSHHRSVMADFVAYLLSRPKHAVPYAVRCTGLPCTFCVALAHKQCAPPGSQRGQGAVGGHRRCASYWCGNRAAGRRARVTPPTSGQAT